MAYFLWLVISPPQEKCLDSLSRRARRAVLIPASEGPLVFCCGFVLGFQEHLEGIVDENLFGKYQEKLRGDLNWCG